MNSNISNRTTDIKNRIKDISDTILSKDEEKDNKEVITFFQDGDFLMTLITTDFQGTYSGKGGVTQAPPENIGGGGEEDTPDTDTPPDTDINLPPEDEPTPSSDTSGTSGSGGDNERKLKIGDKVRIKESGEVGIVTGFNPDGTLQVGRQVGSDNFAKGGFLTSSQIRNIGSYGEDEIEIIQEEQPSGGTSGTSGTSGQGTSGTSGSQGTSGTSGSQGTSGTSGSQGTSGTSGSQGTSGTSGSQGTSGTSGSQGTSGTSGSQGTSGTSGSQGTSGTSGSQGTSGTSGSQGSSGTSRTTSGTSGSSGDSGEPINIENLKRELLERIGEFRNNTFKFPTLIKTFFNVDMTIVEDRDLKMIILLANANTIFELFRNPKNNKDSQNLQQYNTYVSDGVMWCFEKFYDEFSSTKISELLEIEPSEKVFMFDNNDACKLNSLIINELVDFIQQLSSDFPFDMSNADIIGNASGIGIPNPMQDLMNCLKFIEFVEDLVKIDKEMFNIVSKNCLAHPKLFDADSYLDIHLDYVRNMLGKQTIIFSNYSEIDLSDKEITKNDIYETLYETLPLSVFVCDKFNFENNITYFRNVMSREIDAAPNVILKVDTTTTSDEYDIFKFNFFNYLRKFYRQEKMITDYKYRKLVFENSQFLFNLQYEDKLKQFINDLAFSTQIYGI